jgi:hypothetical protein
MISNHVIRRAKERSQQLVRDPKHVIFEVLVGPVRAYVIDEHGKSWLNAWSGLTLHQKYSVPIENVRNMETAETELWAISGFGSARMGIPLENLRRLHKAGRITLEETYDK